MFETTNNKQESNAQRSSFRGLRIRGLEAVWRLVLKGIPDTFFIWTGQGFKLAGGGVLNLLPGLHGFFRAATFQVVVCRDCGWTQLFASKPALEKLEQSSDW